MTGAHPWLAAHVVEKRHASAQAVDDCASRIQALTEELQELLPPTGRVRRHIKEINHHAEQLSKVAQIRKIA